jgi:hypothetical protein
MAGTENLYNQSSTATIMTWALSYEEITAFPNIISRSSKQKRNACPSLWCVKASLGWKELRYGLIVLM